MSKTYKDSPDNKRVRSQTTRSRQRSISVRAVRRDPPDLRKLSRALIALAMAEAAAEMDDRSGPDRRTTAEAAEGTRDV